MLVCLPPFTGLAAQDALLFMGLWFLWHDHMQQGLDKSWLLHPLCWNKTALLPGHSMLLTAYLTHQSSANAQHPQARFVPHRCSL